jgi:succinate-semialdehyde dehydrogenase/glutarate-semialdehyde dehydrogenase
VPVNRKYPIAEVMSAARRFQDRTGRVPTIEWCVIGGVNDSDEQAERLAGLMRGFRAHVNLIPWNYIGSGVSGTIYRKPEPEQLARFADILRRHNVVTHFRETRGDDVAAACGQLAVKDVPPLTASPASSVTPNGVESRMMPNLNPATEEPIDTPAFHSESQINDKLNAAKEAFPKWRKTPIAERGAAMKKLAELLKARREQLANFMTLEMGKPIVSAEAEIDKCATTCEYYAENSARYLAQRPVASDAGKSYVRFDPLGAILAIMPWNFPYWQVIRFAAPTLMTGNVALLKHAPNVPLCSMAIEKLFADAGFPAGTFSSLLADVDIVPRLLEDPFVAAVTLTGSGRAGRSVAQSAGKVLKKCVLELGGSDAFIVLAVADAPAVARAAADARCINSGQSCIASKRFIVESGIYDDFVREMTDAMSKLKVGDPTDRTTQIGPMARLDLLENLHRQVEQSVAQGARLVLGGQRLDRKGFYYAPTVLADVTPDMTVFKEETFGPAAAIVRANHVDHAIALANQSVYGLGCSVWTKNAMLAEKFVADLDAGSVFLNGMVKSDPRLPFGGIKQSGYGRELSDFGIHEFVNIKTVWIK